MTDINLLKKTADASAFDDGFVHWAMDVAAHLERLRIEIERMRQHFQPDVFGRPLGALPQANWVRHHAEEARREARALIRALEFLQDEYQRRANK